MTIRQAFSGYPDIRVLCQDRLVSVVIPSRTAIPVLFQTIIYCLCNQIAKSREYDTLSIELHFPSAGIPIKDLCPKERQFTLIPEANRIRAVTKFNL